MFNIPPRCQYFFFKKNKIKTPGELVYRIYSQFLAPT